MLAVKDPLKRAMLFIKKVNICGSIFLCGHKKAQSSPGEFKASSVYWVESISLRCTH